MGSEGSLLPSERGAQRPAGREVGMQEEAPQVGQEACRGTGQDQPLCLQLEAGGLMTMWDVQRKNSLPVVDHPLLVLDLSHS